jgi:hypothetical protein
MSDGLTAGQVRSLISHGLWNPPGHDLLIYQRELAFANRGPILTPEQVAKEKRDRGWPVDVEWKNY